MTTDTQKYTAHFEGFTLELPADAVRACSGSGSVDAFVAYWSQRITRPTTCTVHALRHVLRRQGAWSKLELRDDAANWNRIVWIAAGDIAESNRAHGKAVAS